MGGQQSLVRSGKIPLWVKIAYTAFVGVLVPFYVSQYGPANFLWFCDVAMLVTLAGLWLESPLLVSMAAVAIVLPQTLWVADLVDRLLTGSHHLVDLTGYMWDPQIPVFIRGLSLFHGWLPFLLVWLVWRLGYDRRALWAQTLLAWAVLVLCFLVVPNPPDQAREGNVNKICGLSDETPQTSMPPWLWLGVLMAAYPVCIYVPSHLTLLFVAPRAVPTPREGIDERSGERGTVH